MELGSQGDTTLSKYNDMDTGGSDAVETTNVSADETSSGNQRREHKESPRSMNSYGTTMISPTTSATTMGVLSNPTSIDNSPAENNAQTSQSSVLKPPARILPSNFYDCPMNDLVALVSNMLSQLILHNDRLPLTPSGLTRFHSRMPPSISVSDYLSRIVTYTSLERSPLLSMLLYIDNLYASYSAFTISSLTVHRFLISAATVASKGLCDSFCTNTHYAKVGGISLAELNVLESEFLRRLHWRILPQYETLQQYYTSMIAQNSAYDIAP